MKSFMDILHVDELYNFLVEHGFEKPTEVQEKVIPLFCEGKSVTVLAQTGTGKTLSYALPLVQRLKLTEKDVPSKRGCPRAIVLVPTKELVTQVHEIFKQISHHAKLRVRTLVGMDKSKKATSLKDQFVDVIIGGPGKVAKALKSGEINASQCHFLILDEADQLLEMGFNKDIESIYSHFEWSDTQVALVSATRPNDFEEFVSKVFKKVDFLDVSLQGAAGIKKTINNFNIYLNYKEKEAMTTTFLTKEAKGSGIIFLNKKEEAQIIYKKLVDELPKLTFHLLHGEMTAKEREDSLSKFRKVGGVLVATDIVARGVDIKDLNWVLNYDLPFEAVYYVHRAGRVGRSGRMGHVYNFVTSKDFELIKRINDAIRGQSSLPLSPIKEVKQNQTAKGQKDAKKKVVKKAAASASAKKKTVKKKDNRFEDRKVSRVKKSPRYKRK